MMFQIEVDHLSWIKDCPDDPEDLCAHGHVIVRIGDEVFEYKATYFAKPGKSAATCYFNDS